jgi:hypothetical protein
MTDAGFATPVQGGRATVCYGVYVENSTLAGKTVKEVRAMYARLWNIPTDAVAYKGKEAMTEDYTIQPNDTVEFFRKAGEKGLRGIIRRILRVNG